MRYQCSILNTDRYAQKGYDVAGPRCLRGAQILQRRLDQLCPDQTPAWLRQSYGPGSADLASASSVEVAVVDRHPEPRTMRHRHRLLSESSLKYQCCSWVVPARPA